MSSSSPFGVAEVEGGAAEWPALRASGLWQVLSQRGRRAVMPEGIRTWVERARAADVDATIGVLAGSEVELADALGGGPVAETALAEAPPADAARGAGGRGTIFYLSRVRQQFPDLPPAEVFPYAPVAGMRPFREAWRSWMLRKCGRVDDPDRVRRLTTLPIATPGTSGALFTAGHLFLDPGETLVVADKRWDGYDTTFGNVLGARLLAHRLFTPAGRLDLEAFEDRLREAAQSQSKVTAILNFPNNPTGYTPSPAEVSELSARVRAVLDATAKPLVLLFDDAYEGFVYDQEVYPVSPFYAFLGLHPLCRPVKCDAITKELLFWGGRLGALTLGLLEPLPGAAAVEAEWENKCAAVLRAIVSSASTPVQGMVARLLHENLEEALGQRERMLRLLRRRRERLRALLDAPEARAVFRADPFNGGFFALLNLTRGSAQEVAVRALREHRVGVVPMEDRDLRINALRLTFASVPEDQLERLVRALVTSAGG